MTIYPSPESPSYPTYTPDPSLDTSKTYQSEQKAYDDTIKANQSKQKDIDKKSSYIAMPAAIIITLFGIRLMKKNDVVGEGIALGGIFTAIYATGIASASGNKVVRLVGVAVFLAVAILIAQKRFAKPDQPTPQV